MSVWNGNHVFVGQRRPIKVLILLIVQVVHSIFCRNASAFGLTWTRASLVKKSTPKKMSKNIGDTLFLVILKAKTGSQNHWPVFFWRHVSTPFVHVNYQCEMVNTGNYLLICFWLRSCTCPLPQSLSLVHVNLFKGPQNEIPPKFQNVCVMFPVLKSTHV